MSLNVTSRIAYKRPCPKCGGPVEVLSYAGGVRVTVTCVGGPYPDGAKPCHTTPLSAKVLTAVRRWEYWEETVLGARAADPAAEAALVARLEGMLKKHKESQ